MAVFNVSMLMSEINEKVIQTLVMAWAIYEKQHEAVLPNNTSIFAWEADVISVTKAGFMHEFEVKCTRADYKRDFKKIKHHYFVHGFGRWSAPHYFWYAMPKGIIVDIPKYAGLMVLGEDCYGFVEMQVA